MSVPTTESPEPPDGGLAEHIGARIRQARAASCLTLNELSGRMGAHLNTVHKLEKGRGTIMLRQIEALLRVLGLELAIVPLGHRERVENWAGWHDANARESARCCCAGEPDEHALLRYVAANEAAAGG